MIPETIARLRFLPPSDRWQLPSTTKHALLCQLEGEDAPGFWTLLMELWEPPVVDHYVLASVQLLSAVAPPLRMGLRFALCVGLDVVGHGAVVLAAPAAHQDRDVFVALDVPPR